MTRLEQERDQWEKKYEVRAILPPLDLLVKMLISCVIGYGEELQGVQKRTRRVGGFHGGPVIISRFLLRLRTRCRLTSYSLLPFAPLFLPPVS